VVKNGAVYACGRGDSGQLGLNSPGEETPFTSSPGEEVNGEGLWSWSLPAHFTERL
jgi:hypothetical protein